MTSTETTSTTLSRCRLLLPALAVAAGCGIEAEEARSQDDATMSTCIVDDDTHQPTATLTLQNDTSGPSTYLVEVVFTRADGTSLGNGTAAADAVPSGSSVVVEATAAMTTSSGVRCTIEHVERFAA